MSKRQISETFVLEIGGRPMLVFAAANLAAAQAFCGEDWLMEELASYRSYGNPIWDGNSVLNVRIAQAHEASELQIAIAAERARREYDGCAFAFLVPIDVIQ